MAWQSQLDNKSTTTIINDDIHDPNTYVMLGLVSKLKGFVIKWSSQ